MAARSGQKIKLLCMLDILRRYSDEEHPLNAAQICDYLQARGISAERKAVYSDLGALGDYGYDIVKTSLPRRGWFLGEREFEIPEIYLLSDAVRTAKFISAKKTRELIGKLDAMLSEPQARRREKGIYISGDKCENEEIYYTIDALSRAVEQKRKVRFQYSVRRLAGREIEHGRKEMLVSPYALTWQDDHYYLIGNYHKYDNLLHLRLDRMRGVKITEIPARPFGEVSEYTDRFDVADYTRRLFGMQGGETCQIELCCEKGILEQVVDRFSNRIFIKNVTENTFCFSVDAAVSEALVTWIINYGGQIEVVSPDFLREKIKARARAVLARYD